jgi:diguanylate cyclase (GGDEF)-like protein
MTGAAICLSLSIVLFSQSRYLRDFHKVLTTLASCLITATLAMWLATLDGSPSDPFAIVASNAFCTISYYLAMVCAIKLYRPEQSLHFVIALGVAVVTSCLFYGDLRTSYLVNQCCRITAMLYTSWVIFRSPDPESPPLRLFALGLGLASAVGMLPTLFMVFGLPVGTVVKLVDASSDASKFQVLLWAISPALVYACVTSVAYSRIAYRFRHSASIDELTGAKNRRFLFERGEKILKMQPLDKGQECTSLLLIDIDHFKRINDTWGHTVGDEVLQHCVKRIREVTRIEDSIVSRYGGEEFCVLLPRTKQPIAKEVAERIRSHVCEIPFYKGTSEIAITVSIGVSDSSELVASSQPSLKKLLTAADGRLYQAKERGRNLVVAF